MLEARETQHRAPVTVPSVRPAASQPPLPPHPAPDEAVAGCSWLSETEAAAGTPGAAPVPSSPIAAPAFGGLPADDDGSLVQDRDSGHLAGGGRPALPGTSHFDLAGIR